MVLGHFPRFSRWRSTSILIAFLLLPVFSIQAALQFDIFLGFADIIPEAGWFPVVCEVRNDGAGFNAILEISPAHASQSQVRRIAIELPTNTRKRVVVPVFSGGGYGAWDFKLLDEKGNARQEITNLRPKKQISTDSILVGALARTVAGVPTLPAAPIQQGPQALSARIPAPIFPDNPIALESLNALYLNSAVALELNVQQANAIQAWLLSGGHLIVGVEQTSDLNANPWLNPLLPCDLSTSLSIKSNGELQRWAAEKLRRDGIPRPENPRRKPPLYNRPGGNTNVNTSPILPDPLFDAAELPVASGTVRDGEIKVSAQNIPLVIEAQRGRGLITVLTFSPERQPFLGWKNREQFWARAVRVPAEVSEASGFRQAGGWSIDSVFGSMIDTTQVRKLPLGWLLLLLMIYLVVIGPLDHYWLKRMNRQMLTWITFPCYVVLFSGLIYYIGYRLRAGETEYNELHLVDILPNRPQPLLRGRTYSSLYSPINQQYTFVGDQFFSSIRGEFMGTFTGGSEGSRANILQRGNNFTATMFVPVWTSQLFVSDWLQPGPAPLSVEFRRSSGGYSAEMNNFLDRPLTQIHLVVEQKVYVAGDLPAHGKKSLQLNSVEGVVLNEFVRNQANGFFAAAQSRRSTFGDNTANAIPNVPVASIAASFVSLLNDPNNSYRAFVAPAGLDLSTEARAGLPILLAWDAGHSLVAPQNKFTPKRTRRDTLLRVVTEMKN